MKCENCILYKNCSKRKTLSWLKKMICKDYKPVNKSNLPPWMKDL